MSDQSFAELMDQLQGGITAVEGQCLKTLAANVTHGCIVEIGSYRGKSAVALACGVREISSERRPRIFCVEPHNEFVGYYGGQFGSEDRGAFYAVMQQTDAYREVALIGLPSDVASAGWNSPIGLLFIDADHRYVGVKRDFEAWEKHVPPGGLIAFDDAVDPQCGPSQLVREIVRKGRHEVVQSVGKIVVLRKRYSESIEEERIRDGSFKILIACHDVVLTGGFLRFERMGKVLRNWGHEVSFVTLAEHPRLHFSTQLPVMSFKQVSELQWDCVMIPGAGFPPETIRNLRRFQEAQFGLRIQHVLNDLSRRESFLAVNRQFQPHIVVFNNEHWTAGTFTDFSADRFHHLIGAVDPVQFHPIAYRNHPGHAGTWTIGGLANKNPAPLVGTLEFLPDNTSIRLFGPDTFQLATTARHWIEEGRLELVGHLNELDLPNFFRSVDCVAMTELNAGWSNLVAEAMASGVPVVCTPHGTQSIAEHEINALVVDVPTSSSLGVSIERLHSDSDLCRKLAENARENISRFSWDRYSQQMLRLIRHDGRQHYIHLPEVGLFGKWPLEDRLRGLEPLLNRCQSMNIIDFGAAEGVVAREFLKRGANLVHGFELDPCRVDMANILCSEFEGSAFWVANLSNFDEFAGSQSDVLLDEYDIVMYLGIQHHLPLPARLNTLKKAVRLARQYVAIRTTSAVYQADQIDDILRSEGFDLLKSEESSATRDHLGRAHVYVRVASQG